MIKHTGYYILDPEPVKDGIANHSFKGYSHIAFWFLENGTYLKSTKTSTKKKVFFSKGDFNYNYPNRYMVNNGDLVLTYHTGEEWEFNEIFKRQSADHYSKEGKNLKFVKWESHPA